MSGRVVGAGRFRVDRKRALEKMERFQLEDPHRYVLEWLAAAVVSGASQIEIENDADDFRIRWAGASISGDELDTLFDHLWGDPEDPRAAMLQHISIGVLGALGLAPKWVHIDSGAEPDVEPGPSHNDRRLVVIDPQETKHVLLPTSEIDGVRCHVREQLNSTTVREALTAMFQSPAETRLIQGAARFCPVPIRINGRLVAPVPLPDTVILDEPVAGGRLWVTIGACPPIEILRHGLTVGHHPLSIGPFSVGGHWRDDQLKLNASRSQIVADERWLRAETQLYDAFDQILRDRIAATLARADHRAIRWQGEGDRGRLWYQSTRTDLLRKLAAYSVQRLCTRGGLGQALEEIEMLTDTAGNPWSLSALDEVARPYGICEQPVSDPDLEHIVFAGFDGQVLKSARPGVSDLTSLLEQRAEGRLQRARAARSQSPPVFPKSVRQRTFQEDQLRGAVRMRTEQLSEAKSGTIRIFVRIDRLPLCITEVESPGGTLDAILDHPGFAADPAFREVVRDATWLSAVAVLKREALVMLIEEIPRLGLSGDAVVLLTEVLRRAMRKGARFGDLEIGDPALKAALRDLAVVRTGGGQHVSVSEIIARAQRRPWWVVERVLGGCPPDLAGEVLVLPVSVHKRWLDWLGPGGRLGTVALEARIERERRLALPRREPVLTEEAQFVVSVCASGLSGQMGVAAGASGTQIVVLRAGVEVCVFREALPLPGVRGVVDGPQLEVSSAHDALLHPATLLAQLEPFVDEIALAMWDGTDPKQMVPAVLFPWLTARCKAIYTHPAALGTIPLRERPLAYRVDGQPLTFEVLDALDQKKSSRKMRVLREAPGDLSGFSDAVLDRPGLVPLLDAAAPGKWRDATSNLNQVRQARDNFLRSAVWSEPRSLVRSDVKGEGYAGVALLPLGSELGVAKITVLWRDRVLTTQVATAPIGVWLVLSGDLFAPHQSFTNIEDPRVLQRIEHTLPQIFNEMLDRALSQRSSALIPSADGWFALALRLAGSPAHRHWFDRILQLPIAKRIGGEPLSIEQVRGKTVLLVSDTVMEGAVDDMLYLRATPALAPLLERVLGSKPLSGDDVLTRYRKGQARRAWLTPRRAIVESDQPVLARRPLPLGGEVVLLGAGRKLTIQPLEDGLPLGVVTLDAAVQAAAVVTGHGVAADRAFERVEESAGWAERLREVQHELTALVHEHLGALDPTRSVAAGVDLGWAVDWVLARPSRSESEPELDAPLFPLANGRYTSLRALLSRHARDGAIAVVASPWPIHHGVQPLFVDTVLRGALASRFRLVDLSEKFYRPNRSASPAPDIEIPSPRRGGLSVGPQGISIVVSGIVVKTIVSPGPLPLQGVIEDDALTPNALWSAVEPDDAWRALLGMLEAASRGELLVSLHRGLDPDRALAALYALTSSDRRVLLQAGQDVLIDALRAAPLVPDSAGGRQSIDRLLAFSEIRAVSAGSRGEWVAGRPPFVILEPSYRIWLTVVRKVRDAQGEIEQENLSVALLRASPWPKPAPPAHASTWRGEQGEVVLWLGAATDPAPVHLHNGRKVAALPAQITGLTGWIDSPAAPSQPHGLEPQITRQIAQLLAALASSPVGRESTFERAVSALRGRSLKELLEEPYWQQIALFKDVSGRPVTLTELLAMVRSRGHVLWDEPGTLPEGDVLVLAAGEFERRWLGRLLPSIEQKQYATLHERRTAKERNRTILADQKRLRKELLATLRTLLAPHPDLLARADAAIDRWFEQEHMASGEQSRAILLAAWSIASHLLHEAGQPEAELAVIEKISAQLSSSRRGEAVG